MTTAAQLRARLRARRDTQLRAQTPPDHPGPPLNELLARTRVRKAPPPETQRIAQLPRTDYTGVDLTDMLKAPDGQMALRPLQSAALYALRDAGGLVAPIGVGHGKTLIGLLAGKALSLPASAWPVEVPHSRPVDRVLYLTNAGCVNQTRRAVIEMAAHWELPPNITVRSYSELSQPTASAALAEWIGWPPERALVVLDEAHKLKRPEAARTKRFLRAWKALKGVRYIVTSGTLISRSLKDAATLSAVALRDRSPLPRSTSHLQAWCDWIDDRGIPNAGSWGTLRPLLDFAGPNAALLPAQQRARRAFSERLRRCPGVVASAEGALDLSLQIRRLRDPAPPTEVLGAMRTVEELGARPDGEVFEDDLSESRTLRQLASGFWYRWDWGEEGPDLEWMDARREWHRQLRAELRTNSREHYDSALLVTNELDRRMARGERTGEMGRALVEWREQRLRRPDPPPTVPVWVSDFLMRDAAAWLAGGRGRLLWYESRAVADALETLGCTVVRAGDDPPLEGDQSVALSVLSHTVGLNLTNWSSNLIIECPSSGEMWEQLLGRTHRPPPPGKTRDVEEVTADVYTHCAVMSEAFRGARTNARMLEQTTGATQKLCYADID